MQATEGVTFGSHRVLAPPEVGGGKDGGNQTGGSDFTNRMGGGNSRHIQAIKVAVHHWSGNTKLGIDTKTTPRLFHLRGLWSNGENEKTTEGGNLAYSEVLEAHHWSRNTEERRDSVAVRMRATRECAGVECPRGNSEPSEIVNIPAGMGGRALVNAGNSIATTRAHSEESYGSEPSGVVRLGEDDLAQCSVNRHAANSA